jgi:hypothetical protein
MPKKEDGTVEFLGQRVKAYRMGQENMGNSKLVYKKGKRKPDQKPLYAEITLRVPMEFLKGDCLLGGLNGIFFFIEPQENDEKPKSDLVRCPGCNSTLLVKIAVGSDTYECKDCSEKATSEELKIKG